MHSTIARSLLRAVLALLVVGCGEPAMAQGPAKDAKDTAKDKPDGKNDHPDPILPHHFMPEEKVTTGSVVVGRQRIDYRAIAGTLVVHPKGWDDVSARLNTEEEKSGKPSTEEKDKADGDKGKPLSKAEASMFFVAYFKQGAPAESRPITFLYNGGPGSSTVWLHMGAFGPKRVRTPGDQHLLAAPYSVVNNDQSLLDVSDLVFIDAPGAGFSRITGPDKEKSFWGVDADAYAFAEFITQFLGKYGRWNSPKYLFGESYGTTRSAVLINQLETQRMIDFNGVILLSQILNFGLNPDNPEADPGVELPYELALPTYAATALYHHKLGSDVPQDVGALVAEVEHFASTDYALALQQGAALPDADRTATAAKLHKYTGLPVDYILNAHLRISGGEFEKELQDGEDTTTGRLDTRFAGPAMDSLEKTADYDPFSASVSSAYVSGFNDYVRKELNFGEDRVFLPRAPTHGNWDLSHHPPGDNQPWGSSLNVMIDLATAMKYNPNLKVQLEAGYYDLATPFFQGIYEMRHLPMPEKLQSNIDYKFYESGHMVYAHEASHRALHDNVADFIRRTSAPLPSRR
jgi:carboxypeptidase C (cathepsin A)